MQDFEKLVAWQKAHELTLGVFRATEARRRRGFGSLISQMRRAVVAIPSNIAEGCGHAGRGELARFLQIALASAAELQYHLRLARDLTLISPAQHQDLASRLQEVKRMLTVLVRRVREADAITRSRSSVSEQSSADETAH